LPEILSLMCVHAHPDDESSSTGGTLAKYASEGALTSVICATKGEEGEIRDPRLVIQPWETLATVRQRELKLATTVLKVNFVNFLGYRDSGMAGTGANAHTQAFCNADPEEACRRLVLNIRKLKPQVLVTYNENGGYGHPDHIMCHRITHAAFELAADPEFAWDDGEEPWQPSKLYHTAHSRETHLRVHDMSLAAGLEPPFGNRDPKTFGVPDSEITTRIDVAPYLAIKRKALLSHRSQLTGSRWETMPDDIMAAYSEECFVLARSLVSTSGRETDLFEGLRDRAIAADDYSLLFAQPVGTHFVA